jgi:hypothetical protein
MPPVMRGFRVFGLGIRGSARAIHLAQRSTCVIPIAEPAHVLVQGVGALLPSGNCTGFAPRYAMFSIRLLVCFAAISVWAPLGTFGQGIDWSDYFPGDPLARPEGRSGAAAGTARERAAESSGRPKVVREQSDQEQQSVGDTSAARRNNRGETTSASSRRGKSTARRDGQSGSAGRARR